MFLGVTWTGQVLRGNARRRPRSQELEKIFESKDVSVETKAKIFQTTLFSVPVYMDMKVVDKES